MAISTVVFDLGGVVCRWQPELRLRELARIFGCSPDDVHRILYGSGFVAETERGGWSADDLVSEVGVRLGRAVERAELEPAWLASFTVDESVLELVNDIAPNRRTGILTNNDLLLREALLRARPDLGVRFGDIVFSAEIQAVKPAAEAYHRALEIMTAQPSEVLFIDDSATNVAGAREAGLSAVRYVNARQLGAELAKL